MRRYPNVKKVNISVVRKLDKARGGHFFDRDTMRFFNSRVERYAYQNLAGDYFFVTSEVIDPETQPRRYSVRCMPHEGQHSIQTVGKYQQWTNSRDATLQAIFEAS